MLLLPESLLATHYVRFRSFTFCIVTVLVLILPAGQYLQSRRIRYHFIFHPHLCLLMLLEAGVEAHSEGALEGCC